jgi:hypothetical protein
MLRTSTPSPLPIIKMQFFTGALKGENAGVIYFSLQTHFYTCLHVIPPYSRFHKADHSAMKNGLSLVKY